MKNNTGKREMIKLKLTKFIFSLVMSLAIVFSATTPMLPEAATARQSYNSRVAAGSEHYLLIDDEGNVWAYGSNSFGQLGDGSRTQRDVPVKVYSYEWEGRAISVAAGSQQSLVLLEDGRVLQWGYNNLSVPIQKPVALDGKAVEIAAGEDTCMAILETGNAVIWSNILNRRIIRKTDGATYLPNVKEISVGSNDFILLRDTSGYAYNVDFSNYTAHPVQTEVINTTAVANTFSKKVKNALLLTPTVALTPTPTQELTPTPTVIPPTSTPEPTNTPEPTITPEPTNTPEPTPTPTPTFENLTGVVEIAAGRNFGVALLTSGEVYTWGNPQNGALGYASIEYIKYARKVNLPGNVRRLSAGAEHTIVILNNNVKFGWGKRAPLGLNPSSGNTTSPVELDIATGTINQIACGKTGNLVLNTSGEFLSWGVGRAIRTLELKENLFLVEKPQIKSAFVGKDIITVEWTLSDYYTEMLNGFIITYKMPDGTEARTQLLPVTQGNINLRGLQPETNYTITLTVYGKTGFEQTTEETVVMTLKEDAEVSPTPTDEPTPIPTDEPSEITSTEESSSGEEPVEDEPTSIFGLILIILAVLILITAVTAIIFVWKKIDREENPKIKPVRISPAIAGIIDEDEDDSDYSDYSDDEIINKSTGPENDGVKALWNDVDTDDDIDDQTFDGNDSMNDENGLGSEESSVSEDAEETDDDDFLTRMPEAHEFDSDDGDDFIVRKP